MSSFAPTPDQEVNKQIRSFALQSLQISLQSVFKSSFSEITLRDIWLTTLQKNEEIFSDGWYIPPPHGIGVLIGNATKQSRTNYDSLRKFPPKNDITSGNGNDFFYFYASPVDKKTGIIGDSGGTFYTGTNTNVQNHLKRCFDLNKQAAEMVEVGMTFADLYQIVTRLATKYSLVNEVISINDPKGVNIGHTVPPTFSQWSQEEQKSVEKGEWKNILDTISKKRVFVNASEQTKLTPGTIVTLEPRFTVQDNPHIPMASYHTTLQIDKHGEKRLLTDFDELFTLFGMDYML